ncbi:MAG: quinol:cytochrome C oxidoreductase [Thermoguttaceae bacterium]|jgi:hypothetical protein
MSEIPADENIRLGGLGHWVFIVFGLLGVIGLAAGIALGWARHDGWRYFSHSYLLNYCFVLSIALGALFFVNMQHITRAGWSIVLHRLAECLGANIPCLLILFLPILIPVLQGNAVLYPWADPTAAAGSELLRHKAAYLEPTFFGFRAVGYFAVWLFFTRFFLKHSLEQDRTADAAETLCMERLSPVAMLFFAGTVTFAAIDWLMSLTPDWYSTIFGVYFFAGIAVAGLSTLILTSIFLQAAGRLTRVITVEHYHDLGKLLLTFVVFWGYIAFSQYLLIWYGDIPEETHWYLVRQTGGWKWIAIVFLAGGNCLIPFCGLLPRFVKRQKLLLGFWALWLLVMHWIDLYWIIMPDPRCIHRELNKLPFDIMDICLLAGMLGIYIAGAARVAGENSLVPLADPRLKESLNFENQ